MDIEVRSKQTGYNKMFLQWCRDELFLSFIFVSTFSFRGTGRGFRKGTTAETQTLAAIFLDDRQHMNKLTTIELLIVLTILILFSCNDKTTGTKYFDIKGSWYANLGTGGHFDSLFNYGEIYITDSTFEYQDETAGQIQPQQYYIKGDSIFKCYGTGNDCNFIPMFKINKLDNDTLWLTINPHYVRENEKQLTFYVRLPKNEKGYYDHVWTKENTDSLEHTIVNDYDRRMWRYHCIRLGELDYYDSLVNAGNWDWNMNQIREADRKEKEYLKNSR